MSQGGRTPRPGSALEQIRLAQEALRRARAEDGSWSSEATVSRRHLLGGAGVAALALAGSAASPGRSLARARPETRVVIVGGGIAGLGCARRLWREQRIRAEVYEWSDRPGGRIQTLRGHFADGQLVEEHAEFINPEHTATLGLAHQLQLGLDNTERYPSGVRPGQQTFRFNGRPYRQAAVNRDWQAFGYRLFKAAAVKASWPTTYRRGTRWAREWDQMSVTDWLDAHVPGGAGGDFGRLCASAILDEYGGPAQHTSALNLVDLLGGDTSRRTGLQPRSAPELDGGNEKWHVHGGNDRLIEGVLHELPRGTLRLGHRLVALRERPSGRIACQFETGGATHEVVADHVVLAVPFTTLREVDTRAVAIDALHRRAIDEQPMGSNAKFFAQYSARTWNRTGQTGNAYTDTIVQGTWDATDYQPGRAGILAALPGGTVGQRWGARYGLRGHHGTPPRRMVEDHLAGFEQLFPGSRERYNGRAYFVWSAGDPYILGAYSYLAVGQYTAFNGIQGRQEGRLHFAGEQTSLNYQGYIEGALRSGYRCADEIAAGFAGRG